MSILIRDFLRSDGSIIVNKRLARSIGLDAAILYSELISKSIYYESASKLERGGYFFSTIEDMERDTTLSVRQQTRAIKTLIDLELIEYEVRGVPPKRFFRLPEDEDSLLKILEEAKNQFKQNAQIEFAQNEQIDLSDSHKSICADRTTNNTNTTILNNNTKKDQKIAAKAGTQQQNTLIPIPKAPIQTTPFERGEWDKVTKTEFLQHFISKQNELFPVKISLPKSKEANFAVSQFWKNFVERFQIPKDQICEMSEKLINAYKLTESDQRYRDCFSLETFNLTWKIDKLMDAVKRKEQYGTNRKQNTEEQSAAPEIF